MMYHIRMQCNRVLHLNKIILKATLQGSVFSLLTIESKRKRKRKED